MTAPDVPADPSKMPKGKRHEWRAGGGTSDPGQAQLPPGSWPGSDHPGPGAPAVQPPAPGWAAGDQADDIVTGPLPALQKLAARFADGLSAKERLAFLRATVTRGQPLADADLHWLLDRAEGPIDRDQLILTALESFCSGMADAVVGSRREEVRT